MWSVGWRGEAPRLEIVEAMCTFAHTFVGETAVALAEAPHLRKPRNGGRARGWKRKGAVRRAREQGPPALLQGEGEGKEGGGEGEEGRVAATHIRIATAQRVVSQLCALRERGADWIWRASQLTEAVHDGDGSAVKQQGAEALLFCGAAHLKRKRTLRARL